MWSGYTGCAGFGDDCRCGFFWCGDFCGSWLGDECCCRIDGDSVVDDSCGIYFVCCCGYDVVCGMYSCDYLGVYEADADCRCCCSGLIAVILDAAVLGVYLGGLYDECSTGGLCSWLGAGSGCDAFVGSGGLCWCCYWGVAC